MQTSTLIAVCTLLWDHCSLFSACMYVEGEAQLECMYRCLRVTQSTAEYTRAYVCIEQACQLSIPGDTHARLYIHPWYMGRKGTRRRRPIMFYWSAPEHSSPLNLFSGLSPPPTTFYNAWFWSVRNLQGKDGRNSIHCFFLRLGKQLNIFYICCLLDAYPKVSDSATSNGKGKVCLHHSQKRKG